MIGLLLTLSNQVAATQPWTLKVATIISGSCIIVLLITFRLKNAMVGTKMPLVPVSIPTFISAMCFGHIIGIGIVLGLYGNGIL